MSSHACLGNIFKESRDLGMYGITLHILCRDSLICNSYLEGFKSNKLYILESTRVDLWHERKKI